MSCRLWIILISREVPVHGAVLFVGLCCQQELEVWQVCVKQLPGSPKPLAPAQNKHIKTKAELGVFSIFSWNPAGYLASGPNLPVLVPGAAVVGKAASWFGMAPSAPH